MINKKYKVLKFFTVSGKDRTRFIEAEGSKNEIKSKA